jgi:3-hydroxymyristoyl/3-hydroxydecanoyl-(acyl carrier protein) dehydratase
VTLDYYPLWQSLAIVANHYKSRPLLGGFILSRAALQLSAIIIIANNA